MYEAIVYCCLVAVFEGIEKFLHLIGAVSHGFLPKMQLLIGETETSVCRLFIRKDTTK